MKTKGRIFGFIGTALTVLYAVYILDYFGGIFMDSVGTFLATSIVVPHMVCVLLAAIFSLVGFFGKKRWAVLTAAILMSVSAVLFLTYLPMVALQAICLFISYARMGIVVEKETM